MSRQIMTPEQISEFEKRMHEEDANCGLAREILDALEAAQQEIADLKRGGVVALPGDLPLDGHDDRLDEIRCWKDDPIRGVVEWNAINRAISWMRARLRTIPADRVLGEGKVAVDREELDALRHLLDCARTAAHAVEDDGECDMSSVCGAVFACDSLRAQPTQEPAP